MRIRRRITQITNTSLDYLKRLFSAPAEVPTVVTPEEPFDQELFDAVIPAPDSRATPVFPQPDGSPYSLSPYIIVEKAVTGNVNPLTAADRPVYHSAHETEANAQEMLDWVKITRSGHTHAIYKRL